MVVGNLLARRRFLLLDHLPVVAGVAADQRRVGRAQAAIGHHALVDVLLRRHVGLRRPDVRPDDALPRHVAGHGRGARLLRRVRHVAAADLQTVHPDHSRGGNHHARSPPPRPGQITLGGVFVCLLGIAIAAYAGLDQGTRNARGGKEEGHRRVQLHQGHSGRDVLRHHERVLLLCADGRRADWRRLRGGGHDRYLDRACPSWSSCCSADSPPTSSGACC